MTKDNELSPHQAHALFDILTHVEVYQELQKFKYPDAMRDYGHPFHIEDGKPSTSPILQPLLEKFVLPLPGIRNLNEKFWRERCQALMEKLGEADLSESYDKGVIGSRRALATAFSTVIEAPAKGCLGGLAKKPIKEPEEEEEEVPYDKSDPDDVIRAWEDFCQEMVYGSMVDHIFDMAALSGDLEDHTELVQAAHEYIVINLASFLHHIIVHSPDGPYLVRIIESVSKLVPFMALRQALKIGNAATMMNAMIRLVLTKLSVTSLTNWIGLSNFADGGYNLVQSIAATVVGWDVSELTKQAAKKEKDENAPSQAYFESIKNHLQRPREDRDKARTQSKEKSMSILAVIFEDALLDPHELSDSQYVHLQEYMSMSLSIKDRKAIEAILCNQQPDILTEAVKDLLYAYEPIIRGVHNGYDLSTGLWDFQCFLDDVIKLSKPKTNPKNGTKPNGAFTPPELPTVEDYVLLIRKHMTSVHRFLHGIAENGGEVGQQYREYVRRAVKKFRIQPYLSKHLNPSINSSDHAPEDLGGAGKMTPALNEIFSSLPAEQRTVVLQQLDDHAAYLIAMSSVSRDRLRTIIENTPFTTSPSASPLPKVEGSRFGPGIYLTRWRNVIDSTLITPAVPYGPVRTGRDPSVRSKSVVNVSGEPKVVLDLGPEDGVPDAPDTSKVVELLGTKYREAIEAVWMKANKHRSALAKAKNGEGAEKPEQALKETG